MMGVLFVIGLKVSGWMAAAGDKLSGKPRQLAWKAAVAAAWIAFKSTKYKPVNISITETSLSIELVET